MIFKFILSFFFVNSFFNENNLFIVLCDTNVAKDVWHYDIGVARIIKNTNNSSIITNIKTTIKDDNGTENSIILTTTTATGSENDFNEPEIVRKEVGCDFGGKILKIAASPQPPLVNCFQDFYGDWTCNGSNVEVINLLSNKLNFKFEWLVLANNNLDGEKRKQQQQQGFSPFPSIPKIDEITRRKNFNYSGVIGLVSSGRAFMAANGIINTIDREKDGLLLSKPFDSFKLHFLLSKSVRDHDHIFIKPFSSTAWLAILLSSIFITVAFYILNSTSFHYILIEDKFLIKRVPLFKCLYYYVTKILISSNNRRRRRGKGRKKSRKRKRIKRRKITIEEQGDRIVKKLQFLNNSNNNSNEENNNYKIDLINNNNNNNEEVVEDEDLSSSFDKEVDKMISSSLNDNSLLNDNNNTNSYGLELMNFNTRFVKLKIEERKRHKEMCKRWLNERKKFRKITKLKNKTGFFKLPYIIWYVVGSLANQGGETEDLPHASSTRILVAFWWLYLIVICSIHSGILTAILTFPKQLDFIQTLDDYLSLKESEKMALKLTVDKNSEISNLLSNPDNLHKSQLQQLLLIKSLNIDDNNDNNNLKFQFKQSINEVDFLRHRQRVLDEIQLGQAAYLEEKSTINLIITQEYFDQKPPKCQFKSSRYPVDIIPMSLILNKQELLINNNTCLSMINNLLARIMQMGLAQKWRRKYEAPGNDCLNTVIINAGDVSKIELRHVILAFWLLFSGLLLGALSLIIEVVWLFTIDIDDDDDDENDDDYNDKKEDNLFYGNYHHNRNRHRGSSQFKQKESDDSSSSSSSSGVFSSSKSVSSSSSSSSCCCDSNSDDDSIESELKFGHRIITFRNSSRQIRSLKDGGKNLSFKTTLKRSSKKKRQLFQFEKNNNFKNNKITPMPPTTSLLSLQQHQQLKTLSSSLLFEDNNDNKDFYFSGTDASVVGVVDVAIVNSKKDDLVVENEKEEDSQQIGIVQIEELSKALKLDRKRKKAAKLNERRARRLKKTLNIVKRLHEGKIYSGSKLLLNKVSHKVQNRARRASHFIVHFGQQQQQQLSSANNNQFNEVFSNKLNLTSKNEGLFEMRNKSKIDDNNNRLPPIRRRSNRQQSSEKNSNNEIIIAEKQVEVVLPDSKINNNFDKNNYQNI